MKTIEADSATPNADTKIDEALLRPSDAAELTTVTSREGEGLPQTELTSDQQRGRGTPSDRADQ